jgi:CheY-like chemotaxis protein
VRDTGAGIPADQQRNIFDEFYQLQPSAKQIGGMGLGLAIVDRLAHLLEHPVSLKSSPGRGSSFSVSVPLAAAQRKMPDTIEHRETSTDQVGGRLIVVIDDDALVLEGMRGTLNSWGCRVVAASTATEALALLADEGGRPDAIISDYRLADGYLGVDAVARLQAALGHNIPAFLITGDTARERLHDAAASGYHLLHKPISPMTLRAMLNRTLMGHKLQAQVTSGD